MRRRRHINVEETRASILDGAEELFGQRGVHAVSLREINAVCGISQGVLHYHFGGRETLVSAILDRHLPAVNETRRRMVDALLEKQQLLQPRDAVLHRRAGHAQRARQRRHRRAGVAAQQRDQLQVGLVQAGCAHVAQSGERNARFCDRFDRSVGFFLAAGTGRMPVIPQSFRQGSPP